MVLYFTFLFFLIVLWILFVYNLHISISFTLNSLKIIIFKIPFIKIKDEKFKNFLVKFIPTSKSQFEEEIDLSSLFSLIHYDLIEIKINVLVNDYTKLVLMSSLVEILYYFIIDIVKDNIEKYTFLVEKSNKNDINGVIKCNFNIGVILINYLLIKRRYKHEKTS